MGKSFIIDGKAKQAVGLIAELMTPSSTISIDPIAIKAIVVQPGVVAISTGSGSGQVKVVEACIDALVTMPKEVDIKLVAKVLIVITGPIDLALHEVNEGLNLIKESFYPNAEIFFGVTHKSSLYNEAEVTLLTAL
jgi:cell division GTPase FtsZ